MTRSPRLRDVPTTAAVGTRAAKVISTVAAVLAIVAAIFPLFLIVLGLSVDSRDQRRAREGCREQPAAKMNKAHSSSNQR